MSGRAGSPCGFYVATFRGNIICCRPRINLADPAQSLSSPKPNIHRSPVIEL